MLGLAIWSVPASPGRVWISIALGAAALGLSIVDAFGDAPQLALASAVLHALFYFWAAGHLMVYMLADRCVRVDELFAVGATFTLVAWALAYVFTALRLPQPGCFTAAVDPDGQRTWVERLFLSFTNLSSTGLSDVVPITSHARSVVMIEQLARLAYVALQPAGRAHLSRNIQRSSVD